MTQRRSAISLTLCLLLLLLAWTVESRGGEDATPMSQRLASVNGKEITQADMDKEMNRFEGQMGLSGQPPDPAQREVIKKKVLDNLIQRELLLQESTRLGVKVKDEEVNEQMTQLKDRFSSEEDFSNALKRLKMTEGELKEEFTRRLMVKKMIDEVIASKIQITAQETRDFYDNNPNYFKAPERVRASHILVKVDPKATEAEKSAAHKKLEEIQKRALKGEDFATLAKESSDCPSASKGGDLDYFQRGQMVAPFEEAAFSLKTGEMSGIIETQFGYHLIKVVDKKESGVMVFDEIKVNIESHLRQQKVNEQYASYIEALKSKAKVEITAP